MPANQAEPGKPAPHDPLVFQQFSRVENAAPFLKEVVPPGLASQVHWPTLQLVQSRFVDARLRSHFSDLVYRANWQTGDEDSLFFYFLFEHKSFVDLLAPLQLLVGMVAIWQEYIRDRKPDGQRLRLPFVYPLVLYHGEKSWTAPRQFQELVWVPPALKEELAPHIPVWSYALLDLQKTSMEEIRGTAQVRMILALLKAVSEGKETEWFDRVFLPLIPMLEQTEAAGFLKELLMYLARSSGRIDASTFRRMLAKVSDQRIRNDVMTVAEELYAQGRQEGRQEGLHKGRQEGELAARRQAVLSALEARFGTVPAQTRDLLLAMSGDIELSEALRLAVTSDSLSEFTKRIA